MKKRKPPSRGKRRVGVLVRLPGHDIARAEALQRYTAGELGLSERRVSRSAVLRAAIVIGLQELERRGDAAGKKRSRAEGQLELARGGDPTAQTVCDGCGGRLDPAHAAVVGALAFICACCVRPVHHDWIGNVDHGGERVWICDDCSASQVAAA